MAERAGALRLVDPTTGEIQECPTCVNWERTYNELQRKYRGALSQIGALRAELAPEEGHELFPVAKSLHDYWKALCRHPFHKPAVHCAPCARTKFTVDRFNEIRPRLQEHGEEAEELCRLAIQGAAYDPFVTTRKNGTKKRHNDFHQVFAADKFMEFVNKAPHHLPDARKVHTLAKALMWQYPQLESHEAVEAAQRSLRRGSA